MFERFLSRALLTRKEGSIQPGTILFESTTPGNYSVDLIAGIYEFIVIAAGGGGADSDGSRHYAIAAGGSGSGFIGNIQINAGNYNILVGKGGNAAESGGSWAVAQNGGNSSISNLITCYGGNGGAADAGGPSCRVGTGGAIPNISGHILDVTLNSAGNSGEYASKTQYHQLYQGGASLYNGYGAGGDVQQNIGYYPGKDGYVKITYL